MVEFSIPMPQTQHEQWMRRIPGDADHNAISHAPFLDFDPFPLPWQVSSVAALGDHAFEPRNKCEPVFCLIDPGCVRDQLQILTVRVEQCFEFSSAIGQWGIGQIAAGDPEQVEGEKNSGASRGGMTRTAWANG
jgi:hypothetical protein